MAPSLFSVSSNALDNSHKSPKRKSNAPHRSIPFSLSNDEKSQMGIVKLDVYSLFKENPKKLLFTRQFNFSPRITEVKSSRMSASPAPSQRLMTPISSPASSHAGAVRGRRRGRPPLTSSRLNGVTREVKRAVYVPPPVDESGKYIITWPKSDPLYVSPDSEGYDLLNPEEVNACSILRLSPMQYLKVKETLVAHRHFKGFFRKREAQKLCRIDVNKTGKLYDWFVFLGWLLPAPEDMH